MRTASLMLAAVFAVAGAAQANTLVAFDDFDANADGTGDDFTGTGFDAAENIISRTINPDLGGFAVGSQARPGLFGNSFFDWFGVFRRDSDFDGVDFTNDSNEAAPFDMFDDSAPGNPWTFANDDFGFIRSDAGLHGGAFGILDDDATGGAAGTVTWAFDVSGGFEDFFINVDVAGVGDFEAADVFGFDISLDGGATWVNVLEFEADESDTQTYGTLENGSQADANPFAGGRQSTANDPMELTLGEFGQGTKLDIGYQTFTSLTVDGEALNDVLLVQMSSFVNASSEYLSFDNVQVFGTEVAVDPPVIPEPTMLIIFGGLLSLAGLQRVRS